MFGCYQKCCSDVARIINGIIPLFSFVLLSITGNAGQSQINLLYINQIIDICFYAIHLL